MPDATQHPERPRPGLAARIILRLMPVATRRRALEESDRWRADCPACGAEVSVAGLGGVRYRASGEPTRRFVCPDCGSRVEARFTLRPEPA